MKHRNIFSKINVRAAKWAILTTGSLLASALFTTTAHATDNCPSAYAIKVHYVRDNNFIPRAQDSDWTLIAFEPLKTYDHKTLELVSVKLEFGTEKTLDGKTTKSIGKKAVCSYNYPGSIYDPITLTKQAGGRLTYKSYILHKGTIKTTSAWNLTTDDKTGTKTYLCDGKALAANRSTTNLNNECGGFTFENHREGEQYNRYWDDAYANCKGIWRKCNGTKGFRHYVGEMERLEYTTETNWSWLKVGPKYSGDYIKIRRDPKPYCDDITCSREIAEMNEIIRGYYNSQNDQDEGMARYTNRCWASLEWWEKQWPADKVDACKFTGTVKWPDLSSIFE